LIVHSACDLSVGGTIVPPVALLAEKILLP
jgi:hypothetical protein